MLLDLLIAAEQLSLELNIQVLKAWLMQTMPQTCQNQTDLASLLLALVYLVVSELTKVLWHNASENN